MNYKLYSKLTYFLVKILTQPLTCGSLSCLQNYQRGAIGDEGQFVFIYFMGRLVIGTFSEKRRLVIGMFSEKRRLVIGMFSEKRRLVIGMFSEKRHLVIGTFSDLCLKTGRIFIRVV